MTADPLAVFALLVALWALYRTRPRTTVVNWNSPVVTPYDRRRTGRDIASIIKARMASDVVGEVPAGTLLVRRPDGTVAPAIPRDRA